ncbi:SLATT domain-containing protein [Octadecabacter sp. G9-8]|uniref:SLATT domain-containing protein n=2 Tax=Octadecabacter dasysiphoniae TaxID=2909341 RepID=A0ABS9D0F9_9RHOB|nr:SLATT domain-containing protein [Octadecabacter dasysiphoniae]
MYTSAGLYIWQKRATLWKNIFVVAPIILGGVASSQILAGTGEGWAEYVAAGLALLAGFFPAIFEALGMDMRAREIGAAAGEFTNLRDRFRQLGNFSADATFEDLSPQFEQLMDRMDSVRQTAPPLPERFFEKGRKKIAAGDYDFKADS